MNQIIMNLETCEAFILNKIGNSMWSIESGEGRLDPITTMTLLLAYYRTGVYL